MEPLEPYRPPHADLSTFTGVGNGHDISANMVESLRRTRPWVLLVGIMGMLACGLMVVVGIGMALLAAVGGIDEELGLGELGGFPGVALGLFYLLLALLYFFPALNLLRYAGAIKRIKGTQSGEAIEEALRYQASFWRFLGLMTLATIGIYAMGFVAAIVFGILGASG